MQGAEVPFFDWLFKRPSLMRKIDQMEIEFHDASSMERYTAYLVEKGFRPIYARVNDKHRCCAEVAFQSSAVPS